jgi:hypothetical protein
MVISLRMFSAMAYIRRYDELGKWPASPGYRKYHDHESVDI